MIRRAKVCRIVLISRLDLPFQNKEIELNSELTVHSTIMVVYLFLRINWPKGLFTLDDNDILFLSSCVNSYIGDYATHL